MHHGARGRVVHAAQVFLADLTSFFEVFCRAWDLLLLFHAQVEESVRNRDAKAGILVLRDGALDSDSVRQVVLHNVDLYFGILEPGVFAK